VATPIVSKWQRRQAIAMLCLCLAGLSPSPAYSAGVSPSKENDVILVHLLGIIDQLGIIPGEGFKSIKLGDSYEKLVQLWGQPKAINKKGTVSYLLSAKTTIHFSGKKNIENIVVIGKPGSLARINNGVVFGMPQGQVIAQFDARPDKQTPERIRYKTRGIELGFKSGTLTEISIFSPKAKR